MKIKLYSYGGSGLRFIARFLNQYIDVSCRSGESHKRPFKKNLSGVDKAIIIYGDPRNAILSFFGKRDDALRRGKEKQFNWLNDHLNHLGIKLEEKIPYDISVKDFLENYEDLFELENYFKDWLNFSFLNNLAVFVKYEPLPNTIGKLFYLLGIDENLKAKFMEDFEKSFVPRISDYSNEDECIQTLLNKRYRSLINLQDSLDDIFIR